MPLNLDTILWLAGVSAEIGLVALCVRTRLFRSTPMFFSYIVWSLFVDIVFFFLHLRYPPPSPIYFWSYMPQLVLDSVFQFAVLVELGWGVLRPIRASLPKQSILILAVLIVLAGAVIWPIAAWTIPTNLSASSRSLVQVQQTFAVLRVVVFMALAGFSQMLSIGWRNRELQIATGLGFYSMISLAVSLVHNHQTPGVRYTQLDLLVVASYLCSLLYWAYSFARREEERQEFTPQMRSFLLAVSGAARSTRITLADSIIVTPRKPGNHD
jgi:hypothetical protein